MSTLSQLAGLAALERGEPWQGAFLVLLRAQLDFDLSCLASMPGATCPTPDDTFVVFPDLRRLAPGRDQVVETLLARQRVAVVPVNPGFSAPARPVTSASASRPRVASWRSRSTE